MNARVVLPAVVVAAGLGAGAPGMSAARAAPPAGPLPLVVVDGVLREGGQGVTGIVDVHVEVTDEAGDVVELVDVPGLVLLDGGFAVAVDVTAAAAALASGEVLRVAVAVDDGSPPVTQASTAVGAAFFAARAQEASSSTLAAQAAALRADDGVGLVLPAALVSSSALARPGAAQVAWENLTGRPAGLDDGDDGNVLSVGAGLALGGTTLSVATVNGALIADGSVGSAQLASSTLTSTQLSGLTGADFATSGLTAADFAAGLLTRVDVAGNLQTVRAEAPGCAHPDRLTTAATCAMDDTRCAAGSRPACDTGDCEVGPLTTCKTVVLGSLVFAP
jgi:hypothetical protein